MKAWLNLTAVCIFGVFSACQCTAGDLSQASVLITGAAGFIGSHLVMNLFKQGCRSIVAIDNFDAYYSVYLKRLRADLVQNTTGVRVTQGDVCDVEFMRSMFMEHSFTHVVHLAAQPGVRYSFVRPLSYIRNNIECFTVLMEQIRLTHDKPKRPLPRLLYASSSSVYGLNEKIPFSEEDPVLHPSNLYGATKRADELLAFSYHHLYGITTVGFRFFTVYGPRGRPDMAAALFTEGILSGKPIVLFNKGELLRDYTYVEDIADGLAAAVARVEDDKFMVYNLGNKQPVSTNTFLSLLEGYLGKKAVVKYEFSKADMAVTFANTSLAAANLGFAAKTSIEEGLKKYTDWFKAHESSLMPCVAECSHAGMCFQSGWEGPARLSTALTEKCSVVVYTISTLTRTNELGAAPADNVGCNIAFLNEKSGLFQKLSKSGASTSVYGNWIVVPVGDIIDVPNYPSMVPKLSPGKFFAPQVHYAIYVISTADVKIPVKQLLDRMVVKETGETAVFAASEHMNLNVVSIYDDFEIVHKMAKNRILPIISHKKIEEHKTACKSYQLKFPGLKFDNNIDSSLFVHDLTSEVAKQFRCRWFRDHQEWTDRDHLSASITLGLMNNEFSEIEAGNRAEWLALGKKEEKPVYAHIVPRLQNPLATGALLPKKKGWLSKIGMN